MTNKPMHRRALVLFLATSWLLMAPDCEHDAPPEVQLLQPDSGVFEAGAPLRLKFSEAIDARTLVVRVWPGARDIENELVARTPLLQCNVTQPCGATEFVVHDPSYIEIQLDHEALDIVGEPVTLEVAEGLADLGGSATGVASRFDILFKPAGDGTEPVEFTDGLYIIVTTANEPIPITLTLISDVRITPDGRVRIVSTDGDHLGDAPANTTNPEELEIDATDNGFTIFFEGTATSVEGERFFETDPEDVPVMLGPLTLALTDVRISGQIVHDEDTGKDRLSGTLSYAGLDLDSGGNVTHYEGDALAFSAGWLALEDSPPGLPDMCGDQCADNIACVPPGDTYPGEGFCEE